MTSSARLLRWLCWALAIFVVLSAILSIGISQNLLVHPPDVSNTPDLVDRLALFQAYNNQALPVFLVSNLVALGVFFLVVVLAAVLRSYVAPGVGGDILFALLLVGGAIGILGQLMLIGANQAQALAYCDCQYKAPELLGQAKAADFAFGMQDWVAAGALALVGIGAAVAGRLLEVSAAFRTLSYVIAIGLLLAVVLQIIDQGDLATIVSGITAGVLVTIWVLMLAMAAPRLAPTADTLDGASSASAGA